MTLRASAFAAFVESLKSPVATMEAV
ncbi:hypothetical protein [Streptomyces broussonetiae]|uniref:Uncharacterized protein n=1 Tax=Streptomyces broussonetiae TaxID=2686304 RepID=A0ABV5E801_9ACTN